MKNKKLKTVLTQLNVLLQKNGYDERFVLEKNFYEGKEFELLVLYHKTDKAKKMELFCEDDGECTLYYLDLHDHFDCSEIEYMFEILRDVLDD